MFFGPTYAPMDAYSRTVAHPPLVARIRALEPSFDGRFPEVPRLAVTAETVAEASSRRAAETPSQQAILIAERVPGVAETVANEVTHVLGKKMAHSPRQIEMLCRIGRPHADDLCQAGQIIDSLPPALASASREPVTAQAVIYAVLLSRTDAATRARQLQLLQSQIEPPMVQETQQLAAAAETLAATARLSLVNLSVPALKKYSTRQYAQFRKVVDSLVGADGKIDLFEYCLRTMLFGCLDVHFGLKKPPTVRYRTTESIARPATVVLSTLSYVGQQGPADVERAFQAGAQGLGQLAIVPKDCCKLSAFDAALAELAQTSPFVKRDIITAVTACIMADGRMTLEEGELLRVIAAVLSCPIPPIAAQRC
jgi:hypothetical protein